jgi:hypothetical protein
VRVSECVCVWGGGGGCEQEDANIAGVCQEEVIIGVVATWRGPRWDLGVGIETCGSVIYLCAVIEPLGTVTALQDEALTSCHLRELRSQVHHLMLHNHMKQNGSMHDGVSCVSIALAAPRVSTRPWVSLIDPSDCAAFMQGRVEPQGTD